MEFRCVHSHNTLDVDGIERDRCSSQSAGAYIKFIQSIRMLTVHTASDTGSPRNVPMPLCGGARACGEFSHASEHQDHEHIGNDMEES